MFGKIESEILATYPKWVYFLINPPYEPPSNPSCAHLFLVVWAENQALAGAETFVEQNQGGVLNLAMWHKVNN